MTFSVIDVVFFLNVLFIYLKYRLLSLLLFLVIWFLFCTFYSSKLTGSPETTIESQHQDNKNFIAFVVSQRCLHYAEIREATSL